MESRETEGYQNEEKHDNGCGAEHSSASREGFAFARMEIKNIVIDYAQNNKRVNEYTELIKDISQ